MIKNETFVYWNRTTRAMYFTNELGFTGLVYKLYRIRKRPSKKFIAKKLKQHKYSKDYKDNTIMKNYYLRGADNEFVEKILGKLVGKSDKNLLWWRIEL